MNKAETAKVLAVLKAAYPSFYKGMNRDELTGIVNLWATLFERDEYDAVSAAVMAHIAVDDKGYPPHPGAIRAALVKLTAPDRMSEMEAWQYVTRAMRNSAYNSAEEFAKLPPIVQRIVGSAGVLREWACMDTATVQSVIQSNFMRSFKARAENEREYMAIPANVREMLGSIADRMKLPEPEQRTPAQLIERLEQYGG